jgi:hypothetical protein
VREKAAKRLAEIGVPALDALQNTETNGAELETRQRATLLVKQIREAAGLPMRVKGMEFSVDAPKSLSIRHNFDGDRFSIGLRIKNTTSTAYRLALPNDSLSTFIAMPDGKTLGGLPSLAWKDGKRPATGKDRFSPPLNNDESYTLVVQARVIWVRYIGLGYRPCLDCRDAFSGHWELPIAWGRHRLILTYENTRARSENGDVLWVGKATAGQDIEIAENKLQEANRP